MTQEQNTQYLEESGRNGGRLERAGLAAGPVEAGAEYYIVEAPYSAPYEGPSGFVEVCAKLEDVPMGKVYYGCVIGFRWSGNLAQIAAWAKENNIKVDDTLMEGKFVRVDRDKTGFYGRGTYGFHGVKVNLADLMS